MSIEYNEYLSSHIENVNNALNWMRKHLPEITDKFEYSCKLALLAPHFNDHDASKYMDDEYDAYDKYFYGRNRSFGVVESFNHTWLHHTHHNPHHWQHWVLIMDDGPELILDMPYHYIVEMICDWWSFSFKSGNLYEIFDWYEKHKDMKLSPNTRRNVEHILSRIKAVLDKENENAEN